jgi:5-methylcytosine-specific restriction protein A
MSHGGAGDALVWNEWAHRGHELEVVANAIVEESTRIGSTPAVPSVDDEDYSAPEGRLLLKLHRTRERNSLVGRKKKDAARKEGLLICSICDFTPVLLYGPSADSSIECHHIVPLSALPETRMTRQSDLALVCANCHRTIHSEGITIEVLRGRIVERKFESNAGD